MANGSILSPFTDLRTALTNPKLTSGHTIYLRQGTHRLTADTTISAAGVTIKPYPNEHAVIDIQQADLVIGGVGVTLENVEIMSSDGGRATEQTGSAPTDILMGGFNINGADFTMRGCYVHDINGIGWWQGAHRGVWRDCLLHNCGWIAPDRGHGHLCYSQHAGDSERLIDNCLMLPSYSYGIHHYGSSPRLDNLTLCRLVQYGGKFVIGGEENVPSVDGNTLEACAFFGVDLSLGYNSVNLGTITLTDNYFGISTRSTSNHWQTVNETGTVNKSSGDNDIFIYPCTTAPKLAHIAAFNWQQLDAVNVDVTALDLTQGASYRLRNALDPLIDIETLTYDGSGAISINMADRSVAVPIGTDAPLKAWDKRFGAFILESA